jgi:transposase
MEETHTESTTPESRIAELEAALVAKDSVIDQLMHERDLLRASHERLRLELELLKRRIFVAKAERVDTTQLELEFATKLAELNRLAETPAPTVEEKAAARKRARPKGRRDLKKVTLPEERVEITDPVLEDLVAAGKAERIGFEESCKLAYQRGGLKRLVVARVKYSGENQRGETKVETAEMPKETFPRAMASPSMLAHVAVDKHCDGLPLYRIEDRFARDGLRVERGTMCRWLEDMGATLGATVVAAMREEALKTAFCIATDATGVLVQPEPLPDKKRQACRRGHFFVMIADRDHILFEYTPKETSRFVSEMLKGYSGYVQADAKSVYDVLFRAPEEKPPDDDDGSVRHEVGCWSHTRTKFWEATWAKSVVAREGLARIGRLFEVDASFKGKPPNEVKRLRDRHLRPHLESFLSWANEHYELVKEERGLLRSALGYVVRQAEALKRVLEDGRLVLENNRSERELRRIAIGRKAWLFVGSDDHAVSAGNLFTLIASARLHRLDPEAYLRDLIRVLAYWPKERYLELAPKYWAKTRARLDVAELALEIGTLTVPPPLSPDAPAAN